MVGDGDCGEINGMKIGRGNRSTRRKPALAPLCPSQIPHDLLAPFPCNVSTFRKRAKKVVATKEPK
jgi:hypothetical protein